MRDAGEGAIGGGVRGEVGDDEELELGREGGEGECTGERWWGVWWWWWWWAWGRVGWRRGRGGCFGFGCDPDWDGVRGMGAVRWGSAAAGERECEGDPNEEEVY